MQFIHQFIDLFLHLDKHLNDAMQAHGTAWTYAVLFAIIFSETGFVVTPFLPGDSLLFAAGALAATPGSPLSVGLLFGVLCAAAISGNTVNYSVGRLFGDKLAAKFPGIIKPKYLEKTHAFYEKYGGETIIITRFVPIVRTFAPFVAGVGHMRYLKFTAYNVAGGALWVVLLLFGGYWFGQLEFVKKHFGIVELAIIIISVMPMVIEYLRHRKEV
ncbi:MAG TPA: DedA family protein [Verrucomicrobiae bacterium]|nr:DedA family protein [Verrucomicrobiae bacterium]